MKPLQNQLMHIETLMKMLVEVANKADYTVTLTDIQYHYSLVKEKFGESRAFHALVGSLHQMQEKLNKNMEGKKIL